MFTNIFYSAKDGALEAEKLVGESVIPPTILQTTVPILNPLLVICYNLEVKKKKHKNFKYFVRTLSIVVGLVIIWRGIWHILDVIEYTYFGGEVFWTAIVGIIIGILLLYIPDHDLKEIEKL